MSQFNYCHGPNCHTYHTQSRIRGVKGNKVLRTRKISRKSWWGNSNPWGTRYWHYFCDDRCKHDFLDKHLQAIINLEPRVEPLETSIEVQKTEETDWRGQPYIRTEIVEANQ